jgi:GT2 family glycosyltransferase
MESEIDVVVATRNRPADLERLLPTLTAQTHRAFRALIVDQSDDPDPARRSVAACRDARISHLWHQAKGKSRALNLALAKTASPIVAFTDDDCTLPERWLETAVALFHRDGAIGMAFGNVTAAPHDAAEVFVPAVAFERATRLRGPLVRSHGLIGMGANMFVRRRTFEAVGHFDEDLGPGGELITGEECELAYRVLRSGFELVQTPELDVIHWGARPIAGGVAREMVTLAFFAIGAGYGKHIRKGDARAALVAAHETWLVVPLFVRALKERRRPFHLGRLGWLLKGIAVGIGRGPRIPHAT